MLFGCVARLLYLQLDLWARIAVGYGSGSS